MTLISPPTTDSTYARLQAFVESPEDSTDALVSMCPIVEKFLFEGDLASQTSTKLLDKFTLKLCDSKQPLDKSTKEKIWGLLDLAKCMQREHLSSSSLGTRSAPHPTETMKYIPDTSCISICVCNYEDEEILDRCIMTLQDKTPLILPSRIFAPMMQYLNESILSDTAWWVYQTSTHDIVLCLPKQGEESAMHALQKFGYDATNVISCSCSELTKTVQTLDNMPNDAYLDQICMKIPHLFVNPEIKKRVLIFGHGGVAGLESYTMGMKLGQTKVILEELAHRGMDYCNLITCCGGKHLLQLLGNHTRSYTVSICSIGDFPVTGTFKARGSSHLLVHLTDTARFWNCINDVLAHFQEERGLKEGKFTEALEYICSPTITSTPLISLKGTSRFRALNVHQQISILDSSRTMDQPFITNSECLLIIPPVIEFPICVKKSPTNNLPHLLSPIPDDNHVFISALKTDEGYMGDLISECIFHFVGQTTTRVVVIKELSSACDWANGTYLNCIAFIPPSIRDKFMIFQKKDHPNKWFAYKWLSLDREREVDAAEVRSTLYHLMHHIKTKTEASSCLEGEGSEEIPRNEAVTNCYKKWFENLVAHDVFMEGLETLDNDNIARLEQITAQLDGPSCKALLIYAVKKNNFNAIPILGKKATGIDAPCISGKTILGEAITHSLPEIVEALLKIGCQPNVPCIPDPILWETPDPLSVAIDKGEEAKVEILCRYGADLKGIPEKCIELKSPACLDLALKYLPKEADLSPALTRAIETDQFDIALRLMKERGAKMTPACLQLFMDKRKKVHELLEAKSKKGFAAENHA